MVYTYSINDINHSVTTHELFDITYKYIDENIVPKLKDRTYTTEDSHYDYFAYGNYSAEKIKRLTANVKNDLPQKFITFIIPIKNRTERLYIQLKNLGEVLDFKQIDCIIVEDEYMDKHVNNYYEYNLNPELIPENIKQHIEYYQVRTGVSWSRSMLMNFGISKTKTPLFLACDVDFIFHPNFMKYLKKCCVQTDFKKYSIGLSLWESHDSFRDIEHKDLLRKAYEPYSACYIYQTLVIKKIGGFDTTIINHGTEERELQKRLSMNGYKTIYGHLLYPKAYVIHYSHDNLTRGIGRTESERDYIMNKNGALIPFIYNLEVT